MRRLQALRAKWLCLVLIVAGFVFCKASHISKDWIVFHTGASKKQLLTKEKLAMVIGTAAQFYQFPKEVSLNLDNGMNDGKPGRRAEVHYTFDHKLQNDMEALFESYSPDYGAFVAMDAKTGRVLSMVSFNRSHQNTENLALKASFPSASVFKVVTAAAAIEGHNISGNTVFPMNGRFHTLYRGQILRNQITRWTRFLTLKQAFAQSVNTVFGRIGAFTVGSEGLKEYADRFGFNRKIAADFPLQEGRAFIPQDSWGLAEAASGYTLENTMSPLQGALIAAAVVNDGVMMEPYVVDAIVNFDHSLVYAAEPKIASEATDAATAHEMRKLMRETVLRGTSRGSFRGFFKHEFAAIDVGGKTGSLTGPDPQGKYDWFVGFAESGNRKIAVSAMTVHKRQWRVKSSLLARRAIETYFRSFVNNGSTLADNRP